MEIYVSRILGAVKGFTGMSTPDLLKTCHVIVQSERDTGKTVDFGKVEASEL
jgi:hypothetical protein